MRVQTGTPIHVYGAIHGLHMDHVPQLVMSESMAKVIQYYTNATGDVHRYSVTLQRPCDDNHVRVFGRPFGFDPEEISPVEFVSKSPGLRMALKAAGFDSFADWSVLENTEPFQIVVFDPATLQRA